MNVYLYCLQVLFMYNSIVINIMLFHKKDSKMSFTMYCHPFKYRHILIIIFTVHKRILKWSCSYLHNLFTP